MRLYRRSKKVDMVDTINLCFFDADNGRVKLALDRLKDLEDEIGPDAKISYVEGVIRRDFLGQGIQAHRLFVHSYEQDSNHTLAACNAAITAPDEESFREWASIAKRHSPQDALTFYARLSDLDNGISYWEILHDISIAEHQEGKHVASAAYMELALHLDKMSQDVEPRRMRAQTLRAMDLKDQQFRTTIFETFSPDERLALKEALEELDRAITLDEYDPELWNLKAAWCVLMERFEEAIGCAEKSIKLRPHNYSKPYQNKAVALYSLKRYDEAKVQADKAKVQADNSQVIDDIRQAKNIIEMCSTPHREFSLEEIKPIVIDKMIEAATVTANDVAGLHKGTIQGLAEGFQIRIVRLDGASSIQYVAPMAQLLTYLPPEAGFGVLQIIGSTHPQRYARCFEATLYIATHAEPIMQRDAARLLSLTILGQKSAQEIRKSYRLKILEPSAAADDEMMNLDSVVRAELGRINLSFPKLIADQKPVDAEGRERARRTILANLSGDPLVNDSRNFEGAIASLESSGHKTHTSNMEKGTRASYLVTITVSSLVLLARYFEMFTLSWGWVILIAIFSGCFVGCTISSIVSKKSTEERIDPGFSSLQRAKRLWQNLPDLTPHLWYGKINPAASSMRTDSRVVAAKDLIEKAIEHSPKSNWNIPQAIVNRAIATQELGLLHRAINEFESASNAYQESLRTLENLGGVASKENCVLAAYRETVFRLAELEHTLGNPDKARAWYKKSLRIDELLDYDDPVGERITRDLLEKLD